MKEQDLSNVLNNISNNIKINDQLSDIEVQKMIQKSEEKHKKPFKIFKTMMTLATVACVVTVMSVYLLNYQTKLEAYNFTVSAKYNSATGVLLDSSFEIISEKNINIEYIKENFKMEPSVEYEVIENSKKEFEIVPINELDPHTIYNVQFTNPDGSMHSWSFQTINTLRVIESYPSNETNEVPINSGIEIKFSYNPNPIEDYFEVTPNMEGVFEYKYNKVTFIPTKDLEPETVYTVTIKNGLSSNQTDKVLEEDYSFSFTTSLSNNNKIFNLYDSSLQGFSSKTAPSIEFYINQYNTGVQYSETVKLNIYAYKTEQDFLESMESLLNIPSWSNASGQVKKADGTKLKKVTSYETTVEKCNGGIQLTEPLKEGYYLAEVELRGQKLYINIQINDMKALISRYGKDLSIWLNNAKNGNVVSGASIKINDRFVGNTDSNGGCIIDKVDYNINGVDVVKVEKEGSPNLYFYQYISPYYYEDEIDNNTVSYIYTDKQHYRMNEPINVWGFIKNRDNTPIDSITLEIYNTSDTIDLIKAEAVKIDQFGCFNTMFDLKGYAEDGYYIIIKYNEKELNYRGFEIKKYSNDNYILNITADKDVVYSGEKINVEIQAKMFDGTLASNLKLRYEFLGTEGDIITNSNGVAKIVLDANAVENEGVAYKTLAISNLELDGNSEMTYYSFEILPGKEDFHIDTNYKNKQIEIEVNTYFYDKNKEENFYQGQSTDRDITIWVNKYVDEKNIYTYYDEVTKTNQETYSTYQRHDGFTEYTVSTKNGKGIIKIDNPFIDGQTGNLDISAQMIKEDGSILYKHGVSWWYSWNTESYYGNTEYSFDYEKNTFDYGEDIDISVKTESNKPIRVMYLIDTVYGVETIFNDNAEYVLKFDEKYVPNIYINAYIYDGLNYHMIGYKYCLINEKDISMEIDLSLDKEEYKPGDTVKIDVSTKDSKGNPVKSEVNISIVDEAYFQQVGEDSSIMSSIYDRRMMWIYSYFSHDNQEAGGGEGGGGGERETFVDTAIFKSIIIDESGHGQLEFTLPDNLTSWRITAQGITENMEVAKKVDNIIVSLPFFIQTNIKDEYLKEDEVTVSIRSNGNIEAKENVEYKVILTSPEGTQKEETISGKFKNYVEFKTDKLNLGMYTLRIEASAGESQDTIIKKFTVVDTLLTTKQNEKINISNGQKITVKNGVGSLYLYNEKSSNLYETLLQLKSMEAIRNDQIIVNAISCELLNQLLDNETNYEAYNDKYFEDAIRQVDNADISIMLTTKALSIGYEKLNKENIKSYLSEVIEDENIDIRTKLVAYWGMASIKQPILLELKQLQNQIVDTHDKILLGLGFVDIGDYNLASQIFNEVKDLVETDNLEQYGLLTLLAIKLNLPVKDEMYNTTISLETDIETNNFLKVFYAKNYILRDSEETVVRYMINGEEKTINLISGKVNVINMKMTDELIIEEVTGSVIASLEQTKSISNLPENEVNIAKKFTVNNVKKNEFKVGDIVTTRIDIDFNENISKGLYVIEDIMPNGMSYLYSEPHYEDNLIQYPYNISGQRLSFYIYYNGENKPYIEYKTRISGIGNYNSDGTILKDNNNKILSYIVFDNISVK